MSALPHSPAPALAHDESAPRPLTFMVRLLGRGHFTLGPVPLRLPYAKAQALLLLLLLEPAGHARERLTDLLWPDQDAATARNNLRHALHLLRRELGEHRLHTTRDLARLQRLPVDRLDLDDLTPDLDLPAARHGPAPSPAALEALVDYQGELMAGFSLPNAPGFMGWLDRQRLAVHARVVACLQVLHDQALATQRPADRVAVARLQARVDPWGEGPHLRLMQALVDAGRETEALAHWDLVRETFQRDLDVQPGEGLRALAQSLQGGTASRPTNPPALAASSRPAEPASQATEASALLQVECRAVDPRDGLALDAIDAVHQVLMVRAQALGGHARRAGGTSLLLRFDGGSARQGPCNAALRAAHDAHAVWRAHPLGERVSLRIGLHRGPLLAVRGEQLDPLGQVAGVAVAVAGSGLSGDILASPAFAQRTPGQDWVLLPRRASLHGEGTLPVLRLAAVDAASGLGEQGLLGRNSQKAALLQAWRRARRGAARAVLLVGAPGAGKSRLLRWALHSLPGDASAGRGLEPWVIDCLPASHQAPAAPLADGLRRLFGVAQGAAVDTAQARVDAGLQRLAPNLSDAARLAVEVLLGLRPSDPAWTPTQRRKELLDAFVALLQARLKQAPLLLVVEDLHWADATTRQALDLAVQRLGEAPLLLLASTRPPPETPAPGWQPLPLDPLPPEVAQDLARQVLHQQGHGQPEPALLQDIVQRAGGNPLFIGALAIAATHALDGPPPSLDEGLLGPLAAEPAARHLARAASVLGEAFSLPLVRTLCPELDDDAFHTAWRLLLRHGLVHRQGEQGRFQHALIRDALYATLPAEARRKLHARTVQQALLEPGERARHQPVWLARHAEQGAMLDPAIGWYEQAALQALGVAAFAEAAVHFAHALHLADRLPPSPGQHQRTLRLALGRAHATVPLAGYGAEDTHQAFRAVLELGADGAGSDEVFQAHYGLWLGGSSRGGYRQALSWVQRVQRHADTSGQPIHQLQAAYAWGNTLLWLGELAPARQYLERAIALHAQLPPSALFPSYSEDTGVIARSLLAWVLWLQGDEPGAQRLEAEALALAEALAHTYSLAFALACRARLGVMRGDAPAVAAAVGRLLDLAQRHDLALWQAVGGVEHGWLLALQGDACGLDIAAQAVELAAPALPALEVTMLSMQADALFRSGRLAECAAVVHTALARCQHWDDRYMQPELMRLAALCEGDAQRAAEWLRRGCAQALEQGAMAWVQRIAAHVPA